MKKIGIIGSGVVAKILGAGFIKYGYTLMMGTRDASKLAEWKEKQSSNVQIASFEETAKFADIVVLAVRGDVAKEALNIIGAANLKGKTVIDTTNPIDHTKQPVDGVIPYFTNASESLMEQLQNTYVDAHFVKAFNSVGNAYMVNPDFNGEKPTMFICGNDAGAKATVKVILDQFGFDVEDVGKANAATAIEQLCVLWCLPGFNNGKWSHAFKLLRK